MRYIRYAFLAILALCLVTVAMANRTAVTLHLLPEDLAGIFGMKNELELPLFIIIFGGLIAGLLVGFFWEWLREHKIRSEASKSRKEVTALQREVTRLKGDAAEEKDEILALLENTG